MCGGPVVSFNRPLKATCSFKATLTFLFPQQHMCACSMPSASQNFFTRLITLNVKIVSLIT